MLRSHIPLHPFLFEPQPLNYKRIYESTSAEASNTNQTATVFCVHAVLRLLPLTTPVLSYYN